MIGTVLCMSGIAEKAPAAQATAAISLRDIVLQDPRACALPGIVGACSTCYTRETILI